MRSKLKNLNKLLPYISFNGEIANADAFKVNFTNRAFQYGDGLFETIKIINGMPCFMSLHLERLNSGMQLLKMQPTWIDLGMEVLRLIDTLKFTKGGYLKIHIFRNEGGKYTPSTQEASYVISMYETAENSFEWKKKGLLIDVFEEVTKNSSLYSSFKSMHCFPSIMAGIYKTEKKLDDCILLNENGHICEAISSNFFAVSNDILFTPPVQDGCVDGIMRKIILAIAKKNKIITRETSLSINELEDCDELFLTNALHGISWVSGYRKKRYLNKVTRRLFDLLDAEVNTHTHKVYKKPIGKKIIPIQNILFEN